MAAPDSSASPVFVLTTSRSGSTLLRFLLESHAELACPPESGIGTACARLTHLYAVLDGQQELLDDAPPDVSQISPEALTQLRLAISGPFARYARSRRKVRWCDKSLDTYQHCELLTSLFPDARFIILTRHCLDVVASGIAADPWGITHFGFGAYAVPFPGNSVAAICAYWLACTRACIDFNRRHPERCVALRYEDLVEAPEEEMARVFAHLGLEPPADLQRVAFDSPHDRGRGDWKVWFSDKVHADSVGTGRIVPLDRIPSSLAASIDASLAQLGYRGLRESRDGGLDPADPRRVPRTGREPMSDAEEAVSVPLDGGHPSGSLVGIEEEAPNPHLEGVIKRLDERLRAGEATRLITQMASTPIKILLVTLVVSEPEDPSRTRRAHATWRLGAPDGVVAVEPGDDEAHLHRRAIVTAASPSWDAVLSGASSLFAETERGAMSWYLPRGSNWSGYPNEELFILSLALGSQVVPASSKTT